MRPKTYAIKEVAQLAGISIRTLHHYDAIGLLQPQLRNNAGYRLYTDENLLRLHEIMLGRQLGLSLEAIRHSLDDPTYDRVRALQRQREHLHRQLDRTQTMIRAVDRALEFSTQTTETRTTMDPKTMFSGFDPAIYHNEVEQRWGETNAYHESQKRTQHYSADD